MIRIAEVLEVSRSQLPARASGASRPRGSYRKSMDTQLLPAIRRLVDQRPTYGYRRLTALLNRERRSAGLGPVNRKRVLRIPGQHGLTLERSSGRREGRTHDGKIAVMASNLRWCSDALEIACWNGDRVRLAFIIDAFDREIIAHVAVAGAGISGSDIRDMMLAAVERRFGTDRASQGVDSTAKCNGSSKADFDVPAKLRQEGLDGGSVSEAFARGEVDGHGDLLDVLLADLVEVGSARQPSSDPPVGVLDPALLPARVGVAEIRRG